MMELFKIPATAKVNRVVPKNSFDTYASARQKKLFTDLIAKITWQYKLSPDTVNLPRTKIKEIQIFRVELKAMEEIHPVLETIDKAIPYYIIFVVEHQGKVYLSTSVKHPHPVNEDNAVIDWTFRSEWFDISENTYRLNLQKNLDFVYLDFCEQLSGTDRQNKRSLEDLVEFSRDVTTLKREIAQLQKSIGSCKQFNKKVELNMQLKEKVRELDELNMYKGTV